LTVLTGAAASKLLWRYDSDDSGLARGDGTGPWEAYGVELFDGRQVNLRILNR
jgi:hypothetical protein